MPRILRLKVQPLQIASVSKYCSVERGCKRSCKYADVFNSPLRQIALHASTIVVLGGYNHDLPTVVFSCIEELNNRSGKNAFIRK
jgi:hypothetical protein